MIPHRRCRWQVHSPTHDNTMRIPRSDIGCEQLVHTFQRNLSRFWNQKLSRNMSERVLEHPEKGRTHEDVYNREDHKR